MAQCKSRKCNNCKINCGRKKCCKRSSCKSKTSPYGWRNISCQPVDPCQCAEIPPCPQPCNVAWNQVPSCCSRNRQGELCCNQSCIYHKRQVCDPGIEDPWDPPVIEDPNWVDPWIPDPVCIPLCQKVCCTCPPKYATVCKTEERCYCCPPPKCYNPCTCQPQASCNTCKSYTSNPSCQPCQPQQQREPCCPNKCSQSRGYSGCCQPSCDPCKEGSLPCNTSNTTYTCNTCNTCTSCNSCNPCDPCSQPQHPEPTSFDSDRQCFNSIGQVFTPVASVCISHRQDHQTVIDGSFGWMQTQCLDSCQSPTVFIQLVMEPFNGCDEGRVVMESCDTTCHPCESRLTNFKFIEEDPCPLGTVQYTLFLMTPDGCLCNTSPVCLTAKNVPCC